MVAQGIASLCEINNVAMQASAASLGNQLLSEVPGRIWDGKEKVLGALAALCKECTDEMRSSSTDIVLALKTACGKGKRSYREAALDCLKETLRSVKGVDHYELVAPMLLEMCDK